MATAAQTRAEVREWIKTAPGRGMNPDNFAGRQCVDAADQFAEDLTGVHWRGTLGAVPGAKSLMDTANTAYFEKVWNDPNDVNQRPVTGDIIVWAGSPSNEWGHVAVVVDATVNGVTVVQQDGFAPPHVFVDGAWYSNKPAHLATLGYVNPGTGPVRGWLRLRPEKVRYTGADKRGYADPVVTPPVVPSPTVTPNGIMHGIDLSSWQKGINVSAVNADFVLVKLTGGTGYVNPEAKAQVRDARAAGRLVGLYHYAHEDGSKGAAKAEAEHFLRHAQGLRDANTVLVLDWENDTVIGPGGNVWARDFLNLVAERTGTRPWLYGYSTAINAHTWATVSKKYPLWFAWYGSNARMNGYADDFRLPFKVPAGFKLAAWQYSQHGRLTGYGSDLDLNVFFGTEHTWRAYAAGLDPALAEPGKVTPQDASNTNVVTKPVDPVHVVKAGESLSGIAQRYGTTVPVLVSLNRYITNPEYLAVGDRVRLPGGAPRVTQCVVAPGDTYSSIAAQFGVTVDRLKAMNPSVNPDYIQPGWVLNL